MTLHIRMLAAAAAMIQLASSIALGQVERHARATIEHRQARWPNGRLRLDATVIDEAYDGEYRTWHQSGAPYELRHFTRGRENGIQQSWTEDGALFLNYEIRDGRRYGFVNAKPCLPIEEVTP